MRQRGWRSLVAFAAVGLIAGACGGSSPLSPEPTAGLSSAAVKSSPPPVVTPLVGGTFTITTRDGTLAGTYAGEGRNLAGAFNVAITGGTGVFAGSSGNMVGSGSGAFTGEGPFSLVFDGVVTTAAGARKLKISIRGTGTLSCINEVPTLTLTGAGNVTRFGPAITTATHQIGNAGCV